MMEFNLKNQRDGLLLVDKPAGWTSFDVVAKIRGQLRAAYRANGEKPTRKQLRVGHAGTLDPFATGLLIILLGEATKKADQFLKLDKVYEATLRLGKTSSTGDPEGEITEISEHVASRGAIEAALQQFTGDITQTPPKFSAIKVNGQRAYTLARQGRAVVVPSRQVKIYALELLDYIYPDVTLRTHVSSGTYIRTLAEDIGQHLGTGAYCTSLRRTSIGDFKIDKI